jgi:hypothetical protein
MYYTHALGRGKNSKHFNANAGISYNNHCACKKVNPVFRINSGTKIITKVKQLSYVYNSNDF